MPPLSLSLECYAGTFASIHAHFERTQVFTSVLTPCDRPSASAGLVAPTAGSPGA